MKLPRTYVRKQNSIFSNVCFVTSIVIITVLFLTDSSSTDAGTGSARCVHCDCGCTGKAERTIVTQRYGITVNVGIDDVSKQVTRQGGVRSTSQRFTNCERSIKRCDRHFRRTICTNKILSDHQRQVRSQAHQSRHPCQKCK